MLRFDNAINRHEEPGIGKPYGRDRASLVNKMVVVVCAAINAGPKSAWSWADFARKSDP
jgi:hypothetical protein